MNDYARFYTENKARLFGYLLRLTADRHLAGDLMQESFTRYLSCYGRKDCKRALLFTIARNAWLDGMRKNKKEFSSDEEPVATTNNPEQALVVKQSHDWLLKGLLKLSEEDRELLALVATEVFSYREIGVRLDLSESNVKVKVHRARLRLKAILEEGER